MFYIGRSSGPPAAFCWSLQPSLIEAYRCHSLKPPDIVCWELLDSNNIQYSSNREDGRLRDKILELYFPTGRHNLHVSATTEDWDRSQCGTCQLTISRLWWQQQPGTYYVQYAGMNPATLQVEQRHPDISEIIMLTSVTHWWYHYAVRYSIMDIKVAVRWCQ